jgi:hypothetical protein
MKLGRYSSLENGKFKGEVAVHQQATSVRAFGDFCLGGVIMCSVVTVCVIGMARGVVTAANQAK